MNKNDIVTLTIDGYSSTGDGVARLDGRAVFVRRAIRGETVEARILKASNSAVFAKIERIIEASPERIEPVCPHFGLCGGCDLAHMSYAEELRYKRERVRDALLRLGGVEAELPEVSPSPQTEGYRNKAIFEVGHADGRAVTGFYRERSHDIIPVESCLIQSDVSNRAALSVREWMTKHGTPDGVLRYVFCREGAGAQVVLVTAKDHIPRRNELVDKLRERVPEVVSILQNTNKTPGNTVLSGGFRTLFGEEYLEDSLCGLKFRLSPRSFYQVNRAQAEALYAEAIRLAALGRDDAALDLYCGAGTLTLALARDVGRVYGVDIVPEAVENARENAERNGLANTEFLLGDAGDAARELAERGVRPGVVVVDPPRKGLAPEVIDAVAAMSPERVVYVSCDPATLARDVKLFGARGYSVAEVRAFDMFPRCAHVECVVRLERGE
ncbi:MAG: 23S rRNA (uracil(1939)-C(5))-methyltransferase RlmD [Oscillospiraceae bacterium]|jgi:23S rRNA (uracil1939-C5)-methyltransferase|nr:23S rRNA (uracil(1939)-C(5))-methyltransferase RlmD [Oscillospiraceae bacterium]